MEVFGMIGMSLGSVAIVFALSALSRIAQLEKKLIERDVLKKGDESR